MSISDEESPGRHLRRVVGVLALIVVGTAAGLLITEVVLRVFDLAPAPGLFTVSEDEFREVPGIFVPGQSVVERPGTDFEHHITINAMGYRGREIPKTKPPGELRILFTGDSFTWGHNVDDDETLPAQLEQRLDETCGNVAVANAGLSGSSILAQQAMILRGLTIDPDLVILMYHENDLDELLYSRMWDRLAENRSAKSSFPISVFYPVVRSSGIWNLAQDIRRRIQFRREDAERADDEAMTADEPAALEEARREYRERLFGVASELAARGVPLLFVAFPHPESVTTGTGGRDYGWVLATAAEADVPVLDLLPVMRASGLSTGEAYLLPEDYHPSPAGHRVAAVALERFVSGQLLSERCSVLPPTSPS